MGGEGVEYKEENECCEGEGEEEDGCHLRLLWSRIRNGRDMFGCLFGVASFGCLRPMRRHHVMVIEEETIDGLQERVDLV